MLSINTRLYEFPQIFQVPFSPILKKISEIVNEGVENIVYYKEHIIVSAEFSSGTDVQAIAFYNAIAAHSAPMSLNLITNALAKLYLGEDYSITASNWPLETINAYTTQEFSKDKVRLLWSVLMPIGFLLVIGSFMIFPQIEVSTNFTQLQYMCGVKPLWYWLVNYVMDLLLFLIISLVIALVAVAMAPYIGGTEFGKLKNKLNTVLGKKCMYAYFKKLLQ